MITPGIAGELASIITQAEQSILGRIEQNRGRQEPDLTSRLMENIELRSQTIDGVTIMLETIDGLGRNAAENVIGADVLGSIHIDLGGARTSKGFLLQAKMSRKEKLRFRPAETDADGLLDASHIFDRGPLSPVGQGPVYPWATYAAPSPSPSRPSV